MNPFEMVIGIVLIVTDRQHHPRQIRRRPRQARATITACATTRTAAENQRLREDIRGLKERIAVLERVITDTNTSSNLDREIEKLRNTDR